MPENKPIESPLFEPPPPIISEGDAPPVPVSPQDNAAGGESQPQARAWGWRRWAVWATFGVILALAAFARLALLGHESFWYDEVVTIRLARAAGPRAMLRLLGEIDATRAPLHPLLLHVWLRAFGPTEFSVRAFSALCGLITVIMAFAIGRRVGGDGTALWAAFLATCSPLMIEYSREARMYALLTLLTTLAWWLLLRFRDGASSVRMSSYAVVVAAMIYTHPLGLLMAAALAFAAILDRGRSRLAPGRWVLVHLAIAILVLPWLPRYLDHPPEFTSEPGLRYLIGMPIGFTGGNSSTLILFAAIIAIGLIPAHIPGLARRPIPSTAWPVVVWLAVPPILLYVYSLIRHPIFGPARYNVFVAPAYLILVARGLGRVNRLVTMALIVYLVPFLLTAAMTYLIEHPPKAAWREAAEFLDERAPLAPVVVIPPAPGRNFELEVARYYLGDRRTIISVPGELVDDIIPILGPRPGRVFFSASLRNESPLGRVPDELNVDGRTVRHWNFHRSLRLFEIRIGPDPVPPEKR